MSQHYDHVPFSEVVERIKDEISHDVEGKVFDYHVADALDVDYSYLRVCKTKNKIPLQEVISFCQDRNISVGWMVFDENVS